MAPELVLGHRIVHDPRSDVYSLGATFYELLTKKPVFDGRNRQELLRRLPRKNQSLLVSSIRRSRATSRRSF